jgi:hypothetical protein
MLHIIVLGLGPVASFYRLVALAAKLAVRTHAGRASVEFACGCR